MPCFGAGALRALRGAGAPSVEGTGFTVPGAPAAAEGSEPDDGWPGAAAAGAAAAAGDLACPGFSGAIPGRATPITVFCCDGM